MALTVEDGTCVADADAFVSRSDLIDYAADYYPASSVPNDEATDAAIRRASAWLSTFPDWDGLPKCGRGSQGLAWPRTGVVDCAGNAVADDAIPVEVERATYLAAMAELASPGILSPTITPGKQQKRVKVDVIEVEYMTPSDQGVSGRADPVDSLRPVLTAIHDLLKCMASLPDGVSTPWPWVA